MKKYLLLLILFIYISVNENTHAQFYAVKTNPLLLAGGSLNGSMELAIAKQWSIDLSVYWNPVKTQNRSFTHWYIQPSLRWWLYEHFAGHFTALHLAGGRYDVGNSKKHTNGWFSGIGASYGYTWIISRQWNLTAEGGIGFYYTQNKREEYHVDDWQQEKIRHSKRIMFLPSKLELSVSYLF